MPDDRIRKLLGSPPQGRWQSIPVANDNPATLSRAVEALRVRSLTQSRETGNVLDSFITVRDLIALGIIDAEGTPK